MRQAALGAVLHASAGAAAVETVIAPAQPTIGHFFGYPFEIGPMIAGACACLAVRFYVAKTEAEFRWTVDMPVTLLALLVTAGVLMTRRPEPLYAILYGTGLGALGAGIIKIALRWVKRSSDLFDPPGTKPGE